MWQATIIDKQFVNGNPIISVSITNNDDITQVKQYVPFISMNDNWLNESIADDINSLSLLKSYMDSITVDPDIAILDDDSADKVVPPPSPPAPFVPVIDTPIAPAQNQSLPIQPV